MTIKFGKAPIGAKFRGKGYPDTIYMKIKTVWEELRSEGKVNLRPRNAVVIEGPDRGGVGFFTDKFLIELIP